MSGWGSGPPNGPPLRIADPRLYFVIVERAAQWATVDELAQLAGVGVDLVLDQIQPLLMDGTFVLEIHGDLLFVHTAPHGRVVAAGAAQAPPNLWERLRSVADLDRAAALWRLIRALEVAGWRVDTHLETVCGGLGPVAVLPYFGVEAGGAVVPVVCYPAAAALTGGVLESYEQAGAIGLAVTCDAGALDTMVTAVRSWTARRGGPGRMVVLVLEAPRFNPTIVRSDTSSITPVAVTRVELDEMIRR